MSDPLLSPSWYRVANLRPLVRKQARFHRHLYRGQLWYVLQDTASGRCHRLTPAAYQLVGLMNGERTTHEIWEAAHTRLGDDGPTQDETVRLLGLLHAADVLRCDVAPDVEELFRRTQRRERSLWWQRVGSPLGVRVPLADPDAFLERWVPVVRPLFTRGVALVCALPVVAALLLAGAHWSEISAVGPRALLDPRNFLLLWLLYPVVKGLHELGHAFATKVWGGEVHEVGILFLVFVPVPYVDASAASVFPDKWKRIIVGAAGIVVELTLTALALLVWLAVEPGLLRDVAYNVMWLSGASTLLFNGNPLLRFDGYYVFADAIEIPNLKARSQAYLAYLVLHRVFGLEKVRNPVAAPGEPAWFVSYGIASSLYRFAVMLGIAVFVSGRFFTVGVLLALFVVTSGLVVPLAKHLSFLLTSPRLGARRQRALGLSAGAAAAATLIVFVAPTPVFTRTQGVIWPPEGAQVRAGADGFVVRLLAEPGATVTAGQALLHTRDPGIRAELAELSARVRELEARRASERRRDLVQAQILDDELTAARAALARARERAGEEIVRSPSAGRFVVPRAEELLGRFVEQGQELGWVVGDSLATARVVVAQDDVHFVRNETRSVEVRLASRIAEVLQGRVQREVPAASDRLPTAALGGAHGGPFTVDPMDAEATLTLEKVFQFDVALPERVASREIGTRVHVRFHHGWEPLAGRVGRGIRRLFLGQIGA